MADRSEKKLKPARGRWLLFARAQTQKNAMFSDFWHTKFGQIPSLQFFVKNLVGKKWNSLIKTVLKAHWRLFFDLSNKLILAAKTSQKGLQKNFKIVQKFQFSFRGVRNLRKRNYVELKQELRKKTKKFYIYFENLKIFDSKRKNEISSTKFQFLEDFNNFFQ